MLKLRLLVVGRKASDPLVLALDDYLTRLNRYLPAELCRLREGTQASEAVLFGAKLTKSDYIIALDTEGTLATSQSIAASFCGWHKTGVERVTFIIGGADGLTDDLRARARATWSLGRITLPHRLAHVILVEQLYRAQTILRGEKYHRA